MFKKIMLLGLVLVMTLTMGTSAFAANTVPMPDVNSILEDIVEYSTYNYQTRSWELDYAIVEDGVLTEVQYNDAEAAGNYYEELFTNNDAPPQTRALPAAVVLVLKAIGAAGGAALVVEITQDIYNYGMTVACENFSGVDLFYDFCTANDYI